MTLNFEEAVQVKKINLKPDPVLYEKVSKLVDSTLNYYNERCNSQLTFSNNNQDKEADR